MVEEREKANFWTTLPGILTGVAALVTAAGGIILGLHQMSVPGAGQSHVDYTAPSGASTPVPKQEILQQPQPFGAASTASTQPQAAGAIPPKAVRITKTDGSVLWSFEDKFFLGGCGQCSFAFDNGQSVPFDKIATLDVLGVDAEGRRNVRIALTNGKIISGLSGNSVSVGGTNDVGDISVDDNQVKRVTFPR